MKNRALKIVSSQNGAVLVLALLVVTLLAIFALGAILTSSQNLNMGAEYRSYQNSLYVSDGGTDFTTGLIMRTFSNGLTVQNSDSNSQYFVFCIPGGPCTPKSAASPSDPTAISRFQNKLNGTLINSGDTAANTPNLMLSYATGDVAKIVVEYVKTKIQAGSSSEFAARYEGIGSGSAGGVGIYFRVDGYNSNPIGEQSTVRTEYKCIEGGGRCL
ncbi:MAG: hypothetical protein HY280_06700 [Nitrospinae bacterium]|nr:hypothetical protein [Nitrospinota bacterium]